MGPLLDELAGEELGEHEAEPLEEVLEGGAGWESLGWCWDARGAGSGSGSNGLGQDAAWDDLSQAGYWCVDGGCGAAEGSGLGGGGGSRSGGGGDCDDGRGLLGGAGRCDRGSSNISTSSSRGGSGSAGGSSRGRGGSRSSSSGGASGRGGGGSSSSCSIRANGDLSLGSFSGGAGPESRAWNIVGGQALVDVDKDTGIVLTVELLTKGTGWGRGSATSDLQVNALRVVLGTIGGTGGVKGNDLVASNIVASGKGCRDIDHPAVVVGNQLV